MKMSAIILATTHPLRARFVRARFVRARFVRARFADRGSLSNS